MEKNRRAGGGSNKKRVRKTFTRIKRVGKLTVSVARTEEKGGNSGNEEFVGRGHRFLTRGSVENSWRFLRKREVVRKEGEVCARGVSGYAWREDRKPVFCVRYLCSSQRKEEHL